MFVPPGELEITPTARGAKPVWLLMAEGGSEEECVGTPVSLLVSTLDFHKWFCHSHVE